MIAKRGGRRKVEEREAKNQRRLFPCLLRRETGGTRAKRKENCRLQSIFAACVRMLCVFCFYH